MSSSQPPSSGPASVPSSEANDSDADLSLSATPMTNLPSIISSHTAHLSTLTSDLADRLESFQFNSKSQTKRIRQLKTNLVNVFHRLIQIRTRLQRHIQKHGGQFPVSGEEHADSSVEASDLVQCRIELVDPQPSPSAQDQTMPIIRVSIHCFNPHQPEAEDS